MGIRCVSAATGTASSATSTRLPAQHQAEHALRRNDTVPMFVFVAYQMMFAIITPALISGAFTNRVTFKAYMLFLTGWLTFVYFPFVHMVWGGGFLAAVGRERFRRRHRRTQHRRNGGPGLGTLRRQAALMDRGPHSIPLVALGTGLLWFGWYGFNAGSEMSADSVTATRS